MGKSILATICAIAATMLCGCSTTTSIPVYYGYDLSDVTDIVSGSKASLDGDLKAVLVMYSGRTDCESDMKSDFQTVCRAYDDKVEGIALLVGSHSVTGKGELAEPIYEVSRYVFESKIRPQ